MRLTFCHVALQHSEMHVCECMERAKVTSPLVSGCGEFKGVKRVQLDALFATLIDALVCCKTTKHYHRIALKSRNATIGIWAKLQRLLCIQCSTFCQTTDLNLKISLCQYKLGDDLQKIGFKQFLLLLTFPAND